MAGFSVGSVDRCLEIIEVLADHPEGMPLSVISERFGLPKSATHRLLTTLSNRRFVVQDPVTQHYRPTMRLVTLGFRFLAATKLPELCQPVLDELAKRTEELVRMSVVDGDSLTWVAKAQGARASLRYDPIMGREVVLHATATGKAWLASLPEADAVRIALRHGFDTAPVGPKAIHSVEELLADLRKTRGRGYGAVSEEAEPGVAAVAAVIRDGADEVAPAVGTVSIAGPSVRMTAARIAEMVPALRAAADELSALWPVRQQHLAVRPPLKRASS